MIISNLKQTLQSNPNSYHIKNINTLEVTRKAIKMWLKKLDLPVLVKPMDSAEY